MKESIVADARTPTTLEKGSADDEKAAEGKTRKELRLEGWRRSDTEGKSIQITSK